MITPSDFSSPGRLPLEPHRRPSGGEKAPVLPQSSLRSRSQGVKAIAKNTHPAFFRPPAIDKGWYNDRRIGGSLSIQGDMLASSSVRVFTGFRPRDARPPSVASFRRGFLRPGKGRRDAVNYEESVFAPSHDSHRSGCRIPHHGAGDWSKPADDGGGPFRRGFREHQHRRSA